MPYWEPQKKRWRAQVVWKGHRYRRQFLSKREAIEWEVSQRKKAPETGKLRLTDLVSQYLNAISQRCVKKVFKEKLAMLGRFTEYTDNLPVEQITPQVINNYLWMQANKRSNNAANKDRKNLSAMWNWGVRVLDLPTNPVIKINKLPHDSALQYTPPVEDVEKVLGVATREERVLLTIFLHTAARRSEIFRLTWEDIDFERREVRLGTRKTKDGSMSYEWLPMTDELHGQLSWWRDNGPQGVHVFMSRLSKPFVRNADFMSRLCNSAGVRPFGFHALRRFSASVLADTPNIGIKSIQRILRHRSAATTERYLHSINRDLRGAVEVLGKITPPENPTDFQPVDNTARN